MIKYKNKLINLTILITSIIISIYLIISILIMPNIINVFASSTAEIVMEVNTNKVVHAINEKSKKFMASTTKILTAITVIENCNINDIVEVKKETTGIEGSSIYLEEGEKLSVKDLLYGLMLRSGNDCAETLAMHVSGSIDKFSCLMNKTSEKIGALNSNFVNPHGLHDDNHYTTAYDLALISCYAMKNNIFREIVGTKSIKIPFTTRNTVRLLINKNKLLKEFDGCTGIKTGYTKKAGRCLVSSALKNGIEFVSVVLDCPDMFINSKNLLTNALNKYKNYKLLNSEEILCFIDGKNGQKYPTYIKNDVILPLSVDEFENVTININIDKNISTPIKKDQEVGNVEIYCKNNLIFSEKIYTILEIK